MKRFVTAVLFLILCGLLLTGCLGRLSGPQPQSFQGYEAKDGTGYVLKLPHKPVRIVSLSIGTDEILMALVAADRVAALTYLADNGSISNITGQAGKIPVKVKASAEQVIALKPDLVLLPDWQPLELVQLLRDAGVPVYVYKDPSTIDEVKKVIAEIAGVVGEEEKGRLLVAEMDAELASIAEKVRGVPEERRKVVLQFTLMGGSGGTGSTFDDICRKAGVINGAAKAGMSMNELLSKEQIVEINPDIFLMPTWDITGKQDPEKFKEDIRSDPALQTVTAVRHNKLIPVPDRHIYASSQYIVYAVRDVAAAAYPDLLGQ